jgi:DNA-binding response OmpR family regulator
VNPARPRPCDVLLVEDDAVLVAWIVHALEERKMSVDVAGDAVEAARLLAERRYKAVVIDLILPRGSGFEIIELIRTRDLSTSISAVVITAADPATLAGLDRGVVKTLFFKPLNVEQFANYLRALVESPWAAPSRFL